MPGAPPNAAILVQTLGPASLYIDHCADVGQCCRCAETVVDRIQAAVVQFSLVRTVCAWMEGLLVPPV